MPGQRGTGSTVQAAQTHCPADPGATDLDLLAAVFPGAVELAVVVGRADGGGAIAGLVPGAGERAAPVGAVQVRVQP